MVRRSDGSQPIVIPYLNYHLRGSFPRDQSVGNTTVSKHILIFNQNCEQWLDLIELRPLRHALCVLIPVDKAVIR